MGIPDHLTCLLRNLYAGQETTVRTGHGTTDWFQIGKGVCQGCILPSRIIFQSEKDERYYLLQYIQKVGRLCPKARNNWHFVPRKWTDAAIERDKALLFGKK